MLLKIGGSYVNVNQISRIVIEGNVVYVFLNDGMTLQDSNAANVAAAQAFIDSNLAGGT